MVFQIKPVTSTVQSECVVPSMFEIAYCWYTLYRPTTEKIHILYKVDTHMNGYHSILA